MFLTEYIILAIHLNSQGALPDMVLNKVNLKRGRRMTCDNVSDRRQILFPYLQERNHSELREAMSVRDQIVKAMNAVANRIQRWLTIYFPEYLKV